MMEQKINEALERAQQEYYNQNYSYACEMYEQILKVDKTNSRALIYLIFSLMISTPINSLIDNNEQITKYIGNIMIALERIKDELGKDNREYIDSWLNIYKDFFDVIVSCHNNVSSYVDKVTELYSTGADRVMSYGRTIKLSTITTS